MTEHRDQPAIRIRGLHKGFTLHLRGGLHLEALRGIDLDLLPGECLALRGPSGAGKSTLLRCIYGNYGADGGSIEIAHEGRMVDMARIAPRDIRLVRRHTLGYVSQFLHAIPRVAALDVVAEPLLERLNIPGQLFDLPPATFSGGEQQRVNIARVFVTGYPILLLDEPTASLDDANRATVVDLVQEARQKGTAILAILHDTAARHAVATRIFELAAPRAEAA